MGPLSIVPWPYRLLAGLLLVSALVGFGWLKGADYVQAKWNTEKLAQAKADLKAEAEARAKENAWQEKWKGAVNDRTKLENQLASARTAASAADDRLRRATGDFQRRLAEASIEACRSAAGTAAALLSECSREYRTVASAADGHLADVRQCESAWPD